MTHDFDPRSMFCTVCDMPLRAVAEYRDLDACTSENAAKWQRREAIRTERIERSVRELEASRKVDAELLPAGTTWGHIRRAFGIDRWPS